MYNNINILSKALDASWKRNEVITNNIANAETPNFKRTKVIFEDVLKEQLNEKKLEGFITNSKHILINNRNINSLTYRLETVDNLSSRSDKNNVNIDVEMGERVKNEILYNTLTSKLQGNFKKLKTVINEGR